MTKPTEQPNKSSSATNVGNALDIKPETGEGNQESADQHPEQPNQEIMIVKTIQSLMTVVNNNLEKLNESTKFLSCHRNSLVLKALEAIDLFERTDLFELQKAFE